MTGGEGRFAPPRLRAGLIERRLLLRSLDLARAGRLTLLTGPAGAGKTVCLAQWRAALCAEGVTVAWLTAQARDHEPAAFMQAVAAAVHEAGVDLTHTGLRDTADVDPAAALDSVLLALESRPGDTVIVIDSYERIGGPAIDALVTALVETAPERVHVALGARRTPRLAVSALRAQGAARTIDIHELRFDREEIARALGLPPDGEEVAMIEARTEGWPVAVALFGVWRTRRRAGAEGVALFNGRSEEVAEYLAEQVQATLAPALRALLTDLALFAEATAAFADHVRGRDDSAGLLEALAAALPGLVERAAESPDGAWRIHPLLADYALGRAELSAGRTADLHRRAATWLETAGRLPEAVAQARAVGDPAFLHALLTRIEPLRLFLAAGAGELRAVLREIPPADLAVHPRLRLMEALAAFKAGLFPQARALLETVRGETADFSLEAHGRAGPLRVEARALELLFGGYVEGAALDERPLIAQIAADAPGDTLMAAWCENIAVILQEERGDLEGSERALERCRAIYLSRGMTRFAEFWLLNHHALLALARGAWRAGGDLAGDMRRQRRGGLASSVPVLALAQLTAGACAYERRFSEDAAEQARQGLERLGAAETWFEPYAVAYPILAGVAFRRGGLEELARFTQGARARVAEQGVRHVGDLLEAIGLACHARAGPGAPIAGQRSIVATAWLGAAAERAPWRLRDARLIALTLWSLREGDGPAALALARRLVGDGERGGRARTTIKGHLLSALAREASADGPGAREAMITALTLAAPEQACAVFAEEGEAVERLVRRVADDAAAPALAHRQAELVLRCAALGRGAVGALNEREARIAGHLRDGASNKLIARRLGLSENTVKFHMKRIFAKLGVSSRADAAEAFARSPAAQEPTIYPLPQ